VPIKFNLGSGSSKDRLSHFCKTFFSDYKLNEINIQKTKRLLLKLLMLGKIAWLYSNVGVSFKPRVSSTQVHIEVTRHTSDELKSKA